MRQRETVTPQIRQRERKHDRSVPQNNRFSETFNFKLFLALLVLGLCPTVYTTVRVFFLGQLPGEWAFSIAGQLSWVNLLYEVVCEAIILPLFFFVGKVKRDKAAFSNRVRTGMLAALGAYLILSAGILLFAGPLLRIMAADESILAASASYIRIESVANVFSILAQFTLVALVSVNKSRYLYILTAARLVLSLIFDTFFVSSLPVSLGLGVNGIGYSNILVNALLLAVSLLLLNREGVKTFSKQRLDFGWMREFARIGGISGLESLVRNITYMVMISRMVNVVGEQGTYWVANNYIWGWLLLPVLQLGELIKEETAEDQENVRRNTPGYFCITAWICLLWCASIPFWKPFMAHVLGFSDVDKLLTWCCSCWASMCFTRSKISLTPPFTASERQTICSSSRWLPTRFIMERHFFSGAPVSGRPRSPESRFCSVWARPLTAWFLLGRICICARCAFQIAEGKKS